MVKIKTYEDFVLRVEHNRIYPFSGFIPNHPSLTEEASECAWHNDLDTEHDPWQWRVRIVNDRYAAYGKFVGGKLAYVHIDFFPYVRSVLSRGTTVEQKYRDGLLSTSAYRLYNAIDEEGVIDSRRLRKVTGLDSKEDKKEYEKALVELQGFGEIVIAGTEDKESGWKSMCYETANHWLGSGSEHSSLMEAERAKGYLDAELKPLWSEEAYRYLLKKLG